MFIIKTKITMFEVQKTFEKFLTNNNMPYSISFQENSEDKEIAVRNGELGYILIQKEAIGHGTSGIYVIIKYLEDNNTSSDESELKDKVFKLEPYNYLLTISKIQSFFIHRNEVYKRQNTNNENLKIVSEISVTIKKAEGSSTKKKTIKKSRDLLRQERLQRIKESKSSKREQLKLQEEGRPVESAKQVIIDNKSKDVIVSTTDKEKPIPVEVRKSSNVLISDNGKLSMRFSGSDAKSLIVYLADCILRDLSSYEPGTDSDRDSIIISQTNNIVAFLKICDSTRCSLSNKERVHLVNTVRKVGEDYHNEKYINISYTLIKDFERSKYIRHLINNIKELLEEQGILISGKTSVNGNSFYLSFDNGVLHGLRISDHSSQRQVGYSQNVLIYSEYYTKIIKKGSSGCDVIHYTVPDSDLYLNKVISEVVSHILREKETLLSSLGSDTYKQKVEEFKDKNMKLMYKHNF